MPLSRRQFLTTSAAASLAVGGGAVARRLLSTPRYHGLLLSAFEDARGDQYVGGVSLDQGRVFGTRIPMRAHGCTLDPRNPERVIFFARRPGTEAYELNVRTRSVRTLFATHEGQHLSGHGLFSADGDVLFTPEHDYQRMRGVVSVRDARDYRVIEEFDTRGLEPHEIAWLPEQRRLLIANGGIMTHPRTFRRKLNIPTMDSSLCLLDASSGDCIEQWRLPDHLLSIRHLSVASDATAMVGLQYQGPHADAPGLAALYIPGEGLQLLPTEVAERAHFAGYVASVCVSEACDLLSASCPYGKGIACWSRSTREFRGFVPAQQTYGVSRVADGSIFVSQRDGAAFHLDETRLQSQFVKLVHEKPIRWDDHWVAAG